MPHRLKSLNVTEPLVKLLRDMDFAFDRTSDKPSSPHIKREQYAVALVAIGRFLIKFGPQHADHFFDLSDALSDLNIGARPVIFRGQKLRSVSNSTEIEAAKANVAFALDALIRLGNSQNDAAKTLLSEFPAIKKLAGRKSHRPDYSWEKTILEWRKSLSSSSRKKNELATEIFSAGRDLINFLIAADRHEELKKRAIGRAKVASQVGVFVARSNTR